MEKKQLFIIKAGMMPGPGPTWVISLLISIIFFISTYSVFGQDRKLSPSYLSVAYSGNNFWNPGVRLAAEWPFRMKEGAGEELKIVKHFLLESHIGFHIDPGSHLAGYAGMGFNYVFPGGRRNNINLSLQPARIYRSFLPRTYLYEKGLISRVPAAGNMYYAPAAGIAIRRISQNNNDHSYSAGISVSALIPYNTYVMPLFNFELGWRFPVK